MHFVTDAAKLTKALALGKLTAGRIKDPNPLTQDVLIIASGGCVDVFTSNGHAGSNLTVEGAKTKSEGQCLVSLARLMDAVRECDGDTDVQVKHGNLVVTSGSNEFMMLAVKDSEVAKFPFRAHDQFDSFTCELAPLGEVFRLITCAVVAVAESDAKGSGLSAEKDGLRIVVASEKGYGAFLSFVKAKVSADCPTVVASSAFAAFVVGLVNGSEEGEEIEVGISGGSVAVRHRHGYSYFPLHASQPMPYDRMAKHFRLDSSEVTACVSGVLAGALRAALVCSNESCKGIIDGARSGEIRLGMASDGAGKSQSRCIVAGALGPASFYNLRLLHNYVSKVDPDTELRLHQVVGKEREGHTPALLVVRHGEHVFGIVNMTKDENFHASDDADSEKAKPAKVAAKGKGGKKAQDDVP